MFGHRRAISHASQSYWEKLKKTVSKEAAFAATEALGGVVASDMLDFAKRNPHDIDRIYVKLRDGMPMAAGMKTVIPNADIRYVVSKEKQGESTRIPISFWDENDNYKNSTVWYADPINATGHTATETLRYVRDHFRFDTALLSHVAANAAGIRNVQTSLNDYRTEGFMNYVHLSTALDSTTGYMLDGLELIPDLGDKIWGTLGEDYPIYRIQDQVRTLLTTEAGEVELIKGTILHLVQLGGREEYARDRNSSWITRNWISACLNWYHSMEDLPFRTLNDEHLYTLIDDLAYRDFLRIEKRPWKQSYANIYSLTPDGVRYASAVYIPILAETGVIRKIQAHLDFLIHLKPEAINQSVSDSVLA